MIYHILPLNSIGGNKVTFNLTSTSTITIVTKFNYSVTDGPGNGSGAWQMDIYDALGVALVTGILLFPGIDLLTPFTAAKQLIGSLAIIEYNVGDHKSPDLLGTNVQMLWFPVGTEMVLPE